MLIKRRKEESLSLCQPWELRWKKLPNTWRPTWWARFHREKTETLKSRSKRRNIYEEAFAKEKELNLWSKKYQRWIASNRQSSEKELSKGARITKKHCRSGRSEVETKLSLKTKEGWRIESKFMPCSFRTFANRNTETKRDSDSEIRTQENQETENMERTIEIEVIEENKFQRTQRTLVSSCQRNRRTLEHG